MIPLLDVGGLVVDTFPPLLSTSGLAVDALCPPEILYSSNSNARMQLPSHLSENLLSQPQSPQ